MGKKEPIELLFFIIPADMVYLTTTLKNSVSKTKPESGACPGKAGSTLFDSSVTSPDGVLEDFYASRAAL
jgi:hypothetical protein